MEDYLFEVYVPKSTDFLMESLKKAIRLQAVAQGLQAEVGSLGSTLRILLYPNGGRAMAYEAAVKYCIAQLTER